MTAYLQQRRHAPEAVPEERGQVVHHLPLLAQLQQGGLPGLGATQLYYPLVDFLPEYLKHFLAVH